MIKGSIVALVTPLKEDKSVKFEKLGELIEYHIENKTDGIVLLGTTGESPVFDDDETERIIRYGIKKANGRIPIIVGCGSNNTAKAVEKCRRAEKLGADYLLVLTPYYNKTNAGGMEAHFRTIADSVSTPIIIYNVPSRTGCSIGIPELSNLKNHKNIAAIKEASGNMSFIMSVAALTDDDFAMYSGNDDIVIPALSVGASGVISVAANIIPRQMHDMVSLWQNGKTKEALEIQLKYLDIINAIFLETNPIPIKEAMNFLGFGVGGYRLPLFGMSEPLKNKLISTIKAHESDFIHP